MTIFSLLESFFFLFLGISFILVLLMVYHFNKKLDAVEKKNETLQDICKTICEELDYVKSHKPLAASYQVDPFYMNFHGSSGGGLQQNNMRHEFIPNVADMFKTIIVSEDILGGGVGGVDPIDIQNFENEELDDVESYDGEGEGDFEEEEEEGSDSTVEEMEDFRSNKEAIFHVTKFESMTQVEDDIDVTTPNVEDTTPTISVEELDTTTNKYQPVEMIFEEVEEVATSHSVVGSIITVEGTNKTKTSLQKLTLQMLKTMVIREEICADPSKFKKLELIQMVLDAQII